MQPTQDAELGYEIPPKKAAHNEQALAPLFRTHAHMHTLVTDNGHMPQFRTGRERDRDREREGRRE